MEDACVIVYPEGKAEVGIRPEGASRQQRGKAFLELDESAQVALLEPLCAQADTLKPGEQGELGVRFFRSVKSLTADGYFTSKTGLVDTLHYTGNTVLAEYPNCEG